MFYNKPLIPIAQIFMDGHEITDTGQLSYTTQCSKDQEKCFEQEILKIS